MTMYRFLNPDHTLVLRDDHVIAWDPVANAPVEKQPAPLATPPNELPEPYDDRDNLARASLLGLRDRIPEPPVDELQLWHNAGSPRPAEAPSQQPAPSIAPTEPTWVMSFAQLEGVRDDTPSRWADIAAVEDALAKLDDDVAGLREQVAALARIVGRILGAPARET